MTICERLALLRKSKGLNKKQLAAELGMPYTTYNNYETGQNDTNSHVLIQLAKYYGVTVDFLLGVEGALTAREESIIQSYRENEAMRPAVDKLLGLDVETE